MAPGYLPLGTRRIVALLSDNNYIVRSLAAASFAQRIGWHPFHEAIKNEIPAIISLLSNESSDVRATAADLFGKLVDRPPFHEAIKDEIPAIIALLGNGSSEIRATAADLFGKLVGQPPFHEAIKAEMPAIIKLLSDKNSDVRSGAVEFFARLIYWPPVYEAITADMRAIIERLSDKNPDVRCGASELFAQLINRPPVHEAIKAEMRAIIERLNDKNSNARCGAAELFAQLIDQPPFYKAIKDEIPAIIALLGNNSSNVRATAADMFGKLVERPPFHEAIKAEMPAIIRLLRDENSDVRCNAVESFLKPIDQTTFHEAMIPGTRHIVALLSDDNYSVRSLAAESFPQLIDRPSFHEAIKIEIPAIIELFSANNYVIQSKAVKWFGQLGSQPTFHKAMIPGISHIVKFLSHNNYLVRSKAAESFGKLVDWPPFHEAIKDEIPAIIALLGNDSSNIRATAANLFGILVDRPPFHEAIKAERPAIIALLSNDSSDVTATAAKLFEKLCSQSPFHEVLGTTPQEHPDLSSVSLKSQIIVAEAALQHSRQKEGEIAQIMSSAGPQTDYILQVGFNESLIRRGVGHLQEIYLFVNTSIPFNSPIFELLGKAFSPFPGVVWMPARSQLTAVFNKDGTEYDRDSLLLSRTERFHKDALLFVGAVSKHDTIPLDQEAQTQTSRNGGNVDRKTEGGPPSNGEASSGTRQTPAGCRQLPSGGRQTPPDSRAPPSGGGQTPSGRAQLLSVWDKDLPLPPPGKNSIPRAYFDAIARINTIEAKESHTLQITGELTSTVSQGRTASVQFQKLDFQGESYLNHPLNLRFIRVVIDAGDKGTKVNINKPLPTPSTDGKTVHIEAEEENKASEVSAGVTASLSPSGKLGGKRTQGIKKTSSRQITESNARTTASHRLGLAWWGIAIRDSHNQAACFFADELRPDAEFEFSSQRPIPSQMQVEVASYWFSSPSVLSEVVHHKSWVDCFRRQNKEPQHLLPYYNFCHAVKVNTPPNMESGKKCVEDIEFNITGVAGDGRWEIKKGETRYRDGEPLNHTVMAAKEEYFSLEKETERDIHPESLNGN